MPAQLLLRRGQDCVVLPEIERVHAVACGDHLLMDLLARSHADYRMLTFRTNGLRDVRDAIGRNLRYEYFTTPRGVDGPQHHLHTLLERDIEARHGGIGD